MSVFEKLSAIDVNDHVKKDATTKSSYLPWAWAWGTVKKMYPGAEYKIVTQEGNKPYLEDPDLGLMVFTEVSIENQTLEMWLPVMDSKFKAMKRSPYTYTTKYGEKQVEAANMHDINRAIMRCLTKNLAMFGLGFYIYAGEDLPDSLQPDGDSQLVEKPKAPSRISLSIGDDKYEDVLKWVVANKDKMSFDKMIERLSKKYDVSKEVEAEFKKKV